jgi:hypothetical protein
MTDQTVTQEPTQDTNAEQHVAEQAAETLAFESSFEGKEEPVAKAAEKTEAPVKPDVPAKGEAPAVVEAPAKEAAPEAPIPKPDDFDAKLEVRKLNGRIGALNDQLRQALKTKETEGKPAVLTSRELTRLKGEYPELAELLEGDIAEVMAGLAAPDPKAISELVSKGVANEMVKFREEAVTDRHENWKTDLWIGEPGTQRTPEYEAWRKTMTAEQADAIESSNNPIFVSRKLDEFYAFKAKASKAEADKQGRLKAALTPQGTPRGSNQTISDNEALSKGFNEGFNS